MHLQKSACYSLQQNYSSTCDNTWDFSLVWFSIYIILCLLYKVLSLKFMIWQIFISYNCIRYEFYCIHYRKCSNNFAADYSSQFKYVNRQWRPGDRISGALHAYVCILYVLFLLQINVSCFFWKFVEMFSFFSPTQNHFCIQSKIWPNTRYSAN